MSPEPWQPFPKQMPTRLLMRRATLGPTSSCAGRATRRGGSSLGLLGFVVSRVSHTQARDPRRKSSHAESESSHAACHAQTEGPGLSCAELVVSLHSGLDFVTSRASSLAFVTRRGLWSESYAGQGWLQTIGRHTQSQNRSSHAVPSNISDGTGGGNNKQCRRCRSCC